MFQEIGLDYFDLTSLVKRNFAGKIYQKTLCLSCLCGEFF